MSKWYHSQDHGKNKEMEFVVQKKTKLSMWTIMAIRLGESSFAVSLQR